MRFIPTSTAKVEALKKGKPNISSVQAAGSTRSF